VSPVGPRFALVSSRVVTPEGVGPQAVLVAGDQIEAVVPPHELPTDIDAIDYGDLVIMPGLVDSHVHINEPGRTEWEGFETATRAAASGGVTTLVDMPLNSSPVTTTPRSLQKKQEASAGKTWVDVGFWGGLVPGNLGELESLVGAGVCGVKAFLCDSGLDEFPSVDEAVLRQAMPILARLGTTLLVHAELPDSPSPGLEVKTSYRDYLASRPEKWETDAIELVLRLCEEFRCRVHVVHLASGDGLALIESAKRRGLPVTVETCPHYLYFAAERIPDADPRFKCAPPLREQLHGDLLWRGLLEGAIDLVATDHSPCQPERKHLDDGNLEAAWGGIASLGLALPIVWTRGRERNLDFSQLSKLLSSAPARLAGLADRKGTIAPGKDADLVVWDPDASWTVNASQLLFRHKITPYDGESLVGKVVRTYLRGHLIYDVGQLIGEPTGNLLRPHKIL